MGADEVGGRCAGVISECVAELTEQERQVLQNMRNMAPQAREMLGLLSKEYVKIFPGDRRSKLRLVVNSDF